MGYGGDAASLSKMFPQGIQLDTAFINPSLLVSVQASIEEALTGGTWVDVAPLLPSAFTPADITRLLEHVPQLKRSTVGTGTTGKGGKGSNAAAAAASAGSAEASAEPVVAGATCVVSAALLTSATQEVVKLAREGAEKALKEKKAMPGNAGVGSRGGSQQALPKAAASKDDDDDDDDWGTGKKGKGGKGGKVRITCLL